MHPKERQAQFIEELNSLSDWHEKFNHLLHYPALAPMPEHLKCYDNKIPACTSTTYFHACIQDGKLKIQAYSNAGTMAGILSGIVTMFDGATRAEMQSTPITFHQETEMLEHLTYNRALVLQDIIFRIETVVH